MVAASEESSTEAEVPPLLQGPGTIVKASSEWRFHGATPESLLPEPKGTGTVWQRHLIRPGRTLTQMLTTLDEGNLVDKPGFTGQQSEVMMGPASR